MPRAEGSFWELPSSLPVKGEGAGSCQQDLRGSQKENKVLLAVASTSAYLADFWQKWFTWPPSSF